MKHILPVLCVCLFASSVSHADEPLPAPVRVTLTDGRVITGRVDTASGESHLRLTLATGRIRLTTPIPWQNIQGVRSGEDVWTRDDFRTHWQNLAIDVPAPQRRPSHSKPSGKPNRVGRAQSITGDAWLGHWNRRPDPDGLVLNLALLNSAGQPVAASGQLEVQLIGLRQGDRGGRATFGKKPDVLILERWGYSIKAADFRDGVALVQLPFRRLKPQEAIDVAADAFLRVRFGVPSQGVFEVSLPDVFIREFSPFRDELYQSTGSRLLPFEKP